MKNIAKIIPRSFGLFLILAAFFLAPLIPVFGETSDAVNSVADAPMAEAEASAEVPMVVEEALVDDVSDITPTVTTFFADPADPTASDDVPSSDDTPVIFVSDDGVILNPDDVAPAIPNPSDPGSDPKNDPANNPDASDDADPTTPSSDPAIPSEDETLCERVDVNNDGELNNADFEAFEIAFTGEGFIGDFDQNGHHNANDFMAFMNAYAMCRVDGNEGGEGGEGEQPGNTGGNSSSSSGPSGFETMQIFGEVLGASTVNPIMCNYLNGYIKRGQKNNANEVKKLQIFLNAFEKNNLEVNGVFDDATFNALSAFQKNNSMDVLQPWGYSNDKATGHVYILTKKKINEKICQKSFPLTPEQQNEIIGFKSIFKNLAAGTGR